MDAASKITQQQSQMQLNHSISTIQQRINNLSAVRLATCTAHRDCECVLLAVLPAPAVSYSHISCVPSMAAHNADCRGYFTRSELMSVLVEHSCSGGCSGSCWATRRLVAHGEYDESGRALKLHGDFLEL